MKKLAIPTLVMGILLVSVSVVRGQSKPQLDSMIQAEAKAEETPLILKFEPRFAAHETARRMEIENKRALIDSLDISESRRLKLIRDLYKSEPTRRLSKALLADSRYEEDPR